MSKKKLIKELGENYCGNCGDNMEWGWNFCPYCGCEVDDESGEEE